MDSPSTDILEAPPWLSKAATSAHDVLFEWLRHKISRLMIKEISANDRGDDAAEHLNGVAVRLYQGEPHPRVIPWHPREVLELERWAEPAREYAGQPPSGQRGHTKRLLACAILLRNVGHLPSPQPHSAEEFFIETCTATLLRFTESAIAIGGEVPYFVVQFLLWLYRVQAHPNIRAFTAFSIVLLVAHEAPRNKRIRDGNAAELCEWCVEIEKHSRRAIGRHASSDSWLIGLSSYEDRKGSRERWHILAETILGTGDLPDSSQTVFAELARRLPKL